VGETGPKTEAKIQEALGGVLFVDEAYGLLGNNTIGGGASNYGEEAITVLLKEMEDRRGQFCVVLAGYKEEMQILLNTNPGFESRLQFTLEFPDYSREELEQIAQVFLSKKKYTIEPPALELLLDTVEYYRNRPNFANARTVRNVLDQVLMNQNLRTENLDDDNVVIRNDVEDYLLDEGIDLKSVARKKGTIGFV
jgi:SpoVK/Ycf46/Vps4 family AAA+-type ATPase